MTNANRIRVDMVDWVYLGWGGGLRQLRPAPGILMVPDGTAVPGENKLSGLRKYDGFIPPANNEVLFVPRFVHGIKAAGHTWKALGLWVRLRTGTSPAQHATFFTRESDISDIETMMSRSEIVFFGVWEKIRHEQIRHTRPS